MGSHVDSTRCALNSHCKNYVARKNSSPQKMKHSSTLMDGVMLGLYRNNGKENGKENGNYYSGLYRGSLYYKKGTVLRIFIIEEVRYHEGKGFLLYGAR